jgi:hypothetical protein
MELRCNGSPVWAICSNRGPHLTSFLQSVRLIFPATLREQWSLAGGPFMYCSHCGNQLFHKDLNNAGFCARCDAVVDVSPCKVAFWNLMAVFIMLWTLALPC